MHLIVVLSFLASAFVDAGAALTLHSRAGSAATVYTGCKDPKTVAVTFDDGPYQWTKTISDIFTNAGGHCTFFMIGLTDYGRMTVASGDCIYDSPQVASVKYVYSKGHQIGSHTWSHPDLTTLSASQIRLEISKVDDALQNIIGAKPTCFRPPYGYYNDLVRSVAGETGKHIIIWDFDSGDSTGSSATASEKAYDNQIAKHVNNFLALNHETEGHTDCVSVNQVMPYAVNALKKAGYKMITVAECIGVTPYYNVGTPGNRTAAWHC
ncbi:unnamed protein product [Mycena citricolor]|uniref:NodB homology domain-containing protein n=1 Tax=Mycena citricolor TaxID=2018698 RepID=A0AAD2H3R1_9AGAR|nr:unnamed protein product [Mycena citricolor]